MTRNSSRELLGNAIRKKTEAILLLDEGGLLEEYHDPMLPEARQFEYEIVMPDARCKRVARSLVLSLIMSGTVHPHYVTRRNEFHTRTWRRAAK